MIVRNRQTHRYLNIKLNRITMCIKYKRDHVIVLSNMGISHSIFALYILIDLISALNNHI